MKNIKIFLVLFFVLTIQLVKGQSNDCANFDTVNSDSESEGNACITSNVNPNIGYEVGQTYTFEVVGVPSDASIGWVSSGIAPRPRRNVSRFTAEVIRRFVTIGVDVSNTNGFSGQGELVIDIAPDPSDPVMTVPPCISNCDNLGLKSGDFEQSDERILWADWTRKVKNADGTENIYGLYNRISEYDDCHDNASEVLRVCLGNANGGREEELRCESDYEYDTARCGDDFLNLPEISNEHAITSATTNFLQSFTTGQFYPDAHNRYAEGTTNTHSLVLGHGNGSPAEGELSDQAVEATIEQTFFLGEDISPRLDFWFAWQTYKYESTEAEPTEEELERFINAPVFSIKVYTIDQDGNLLETIYQKVESQENADLQSPFTGLFTQGWNYEPIYIDLSGYQYQTIKVEITSYDRFRVDADGMVTDRINSAAIVDFICSQCCVPAPNITASVSNSDGVFTITRPTLSCESTAIAESERCTPNFFYQITSPQGEPYVVEGTGTTIDFIPKYAGQHTVYYKHSKSCCWSEEPLTFNVLETELSSTSIPFSNEIKSAGIHCVPSFYMDSVLAVGATTFLDRQFVNTQEIAQTENKEAIENYLLGTNPYLSGERGVWRTEGSFAYVTERRGTKTMAIAEREGSTSLIDEEKKGTLARTGGTFDLNMFNWQNRGVLPENWRKVSETSRYNPYTYGIESRDVLGRYSAALYGYKGQLSTAVCANAEYAEIASEGFEEPSATSNFRIENPASGTIDRSLVFQVLWAKGNKGVLEGYVPKEGSPITLDASLIAYMIGKQDIIEIKSKLVNEVLTEQMQVTLTRRDDKTSFFTIAGDNLPDALFLNQWYGTMAIARELPALPVVALEIDNITEGHTGKKSLPISQETTILQSDLLLKSGEKYIVGAWVKVKTEETQLYTYKDVGLSLVFYKKDGSQFSISSEIKPLGNIIEGWQRIEGTITVPDDAFFVAVRFTNTNPTVALYDDIRIFPADGSMKTFVYDPSNYLLRAVLDENNYASLYFYDDAQRLYLLQKETREGIYTIQETHNHVKHRSQD